MSEKHKPSKPEVIKPSQKEDSVKVLNSPLTSSSTDLSSTNSPEEKNL